MLSARARQEERIIIKWINLKMEGKMGGSREKNEKISTTVTKARRERERALRVCTFSTRKVFEPISPILSPCEIRPKHATIATFRSSKEYVTKSGSNELQTLCGFDTLPLSLTREQRKKKKKKKSKEEL